MTVGERLVGFIVAVASVEETSGSFGWPADKLKTWLLVMGRGELNKRFRQHPHAPMPDTQALAGSVLGPPRQLTMRRRMRHGINAVAADNLDDMNASTSRAFMTTVAAEIGTNQSTPPSPKARKIGIALFLGIAAIPFVFCWFTLRAGHTKFSRVVAFAWLAAYVVGNLSQGSHPQASSSVAAASPTATNLSSIAGKTLMCSGSQTTYRYDGTLQIDGFVDPEKTVPHRLVGTYSQTGNSLTTTITRAYIPDSIGAARFPDFADSRSVIITSYSVARSGDSFVMTQTSRSFNGQPRKPGTKSMVCN